MIAGALPAVFKLSKADRNLLTAATDTVLPAKAAWESWLEDNDIGTADTREQSLFAAVYCNLKGHLGDAPENLLKGISRRNWYANQLIFSTLMSLRQLLEQSAVPSIAVNDVALACAYFPEMSARRINSIDLLVPSRHLELSAQQVLTAGWKLREVESYRSTESASMLIFDGETGPPLRLWSGVFTAMPQKALEAAVWENSVEIDEKELRCSVLDSAGQLLLTAASLSRQDQLSLVQFVDALSLIQRLQTEDQWSGLVGQAQRYEYVLPLRSLLRFCGEVLGASVPDWVLPALRRMPISHGELKRYPAACDRIGLKLKASVFRLLSLTR